MYELFYGPTYNSQVEDLPRCRHEQPIPTSIFGSALCHAEHEFAALWTAEGLDLKTSIDSTTGSSMVERTMASKRSGTTSAVNRELPVCRNEGKTAEESSTKINRYRPTQNIPEYLMAISPTQKQELPSKFEDCWESCNHFQSVLAR